MRYIFSKWRVTTITTIKISFYAHVFVASGKICERSTLKERDREKDVTHVSESVHRFQGPLRALPPEDFNFFLSGVQGEPVQEKKFPSSPDCQIAIRDRKYTDLLTLS